MRQRLNFNSRRKDFWEDRASESGPSEFTDGFLMLSMMLANGALSA
jgi:hypothetical protein